MVSFATVYGRRSCAIPDGSRRLLRLRSPVDNDYCGIPAFMLTRLCRKECSLDGDDDSLS